MRRIRLVLKETEQAIPFRSISGWFESVLSMTFERKTSLYQRKS
ncbi:hypothetical protein RchiOBHm_Chr6g0282981 [Rosa chinensis]|uniref:Uncharacterized protein n=1 Tax=Rosa chinensis TaxID=74649 RepID=A0A2P6PTW3_ROSCH|nr:hypothetical protein RchiOBHm_Chr6g0282981 [Rosa chinensis]